MAYLCNLHYNKQCSATIAGHLSKFDHDPPRVKNKIKMQKWFMYEY